MLRRMTSYHSHDNQLYGAINTTMIYYSHGKGKLATLINGMSLEEERFNYVSSYNRCNNNRKYSSAVVYFAERSIQRKAYKKNV